MMVSFLMIGQSNMAGRGKKTEISAIPHKNKLFMLRNGKFIALCEPVNYDRPFSGTCLATSFAHYYSKDHPDETVGLIPAADGGSSLEDWRVGGELYTNAVNLCRLAMRSSKLSGILWHQGEAECGSEQTIASYEERFLTILNAMKAELELPDDIPVIIGGLGDFLAKRAISPQLRNYTKVNDVLVSIAEKQDSIYYVSAKALTSNADYLHFNAASLHAFGLRYYRAFRDRKSYLDEYFKNAKTIRTAWSEGAIDSETASINDKIASLAALMSAGKITREEYERRSKELMSQL